MALKGSVEIKSWKGWGKSGRTILDLSRRSQLPCNVQLQYSSGETIAMKRHFHRKVWSYVEVEHDYHQKEMTPHAHENVMDHMILQYRDYRSALSQKKYQDAHS